MFSMRWTCVYFLAACLVAECHVKLNVPRVRLPYFDNLSVNFTLQVGTPGCYRWSVSRQDIISITTEGLTPANDETLTEYNGAPCSDKAVISTVPRASPCCPATAIVYAEDAVTKETVRCDVIIDKITSIYIRTTTKELHLEEAPSKFYIQAYGSKDNEFSTLDGIPFIWALESFKETSTLIDPQSIMRFMPFSESPYKAPPGVAALEAKRQQGDAVLVEGIKTGSAVVVARINDPLYRSIDSRVRIVVVANLILEPNEAFVVPGTIVPLKLIQIKHGQKVEIKLPSSVYEFEVTNSSVIDYDPKVSEIKALAYGESKIMVKDKNCVDGLEDEQPESLTSRIYVREPKFLSLHVMPHRNWALTINQEYEIHVEVYDAENQKITLGDNVFVETKFDPMFFRVDYSSPNGTYHYGVPIKKGSAFVTAVLKKITMADGSVLEPSGQPRVKAEMEIFQNIAINPKETILPWDPTVQPKYELRWSPSGGSGSFVWSSTNSSVVTVSQSGTAKTSWFGSVNVTAAASVNSNIKGHARVHILPPTGMEIIPHIVEAEVGVAIQVPLAFYTVRPNDINKTRVSYSSCGKLPFKVEVLDPNFEFNSKTHYPHMKPACVVLPVVGKTLGSSLVNVKYSVNGLAFEDSVTVSTFKPLEVLEPVSLITVLAVGSSRQVVFHGGPRPLLEKHAGFERKLTVQNETVALQREVKLDEGAKDDLYVYEVICREVGTTEVAFSIGNTKSSATENAVVRIAVVNVICAEPSKMYFKVETPLKANCPNDGSAAQVVRVSVPNYEQTLVSVIAKDSNGKKFDNISSLQIDWTSNPDLVGFSNLGHVVTEPIRHDLGYIVPGKSYQTILPREKSGNVEVTAEIKGYRDEYLRTFSIRARKLAPQYEDDNELRHSMDLQLVADLSVEPTVVNVFNHPSAKAYVQIQNGSGHFEVDTGNTSVVDVIYLESNKTLVIQPLAQGSVKIKIRDRCITSKTDAEVSVDVNGVGFIQVDVEDEIKLGDETTMQVSVYDFARNILKPEMLKLVRLQLHAPKSEVLQITQLPTSKPENFLRFNVKGKALGEATIAFSADGHEEIMGVGSIKSIPKTISVFPPLKLSPSRMTMLIGSVYQIMSYGGPQTNSQLQFTTETDETIQVSSSGLVTGKVVGRTRIHGRSIDITTKKLYSEDHVEVEVVNLKGIRIVSPLTHILNNERMPLRAVGLTDNQDIDTSLLLGADSPIMTFEWSSSNSECGELVHPFQVNGYNPPSGDQAQLQFHARRPGTTTIKLTVVFAKKKFTAAVDISVTDQMVLLNHPQTGPSILMTPNSEISLKTNKDSDALVSYTIQCGKDPKVADRAIVTVDGNGIVRSNDLIGQAVILVNAVEKFGLVQSKTVIVEVKRVSYIMASPFLPVNFSNKQLRVLPRGIPVYITTTFHDNTGRAFNSVSHTTKSRPNRFDAIQIDAEPSNHTYKVSTISEDRVSIKVLDETGDQLVDYLSFSVGEAIEPKLPMNSLNVGDIVCFTCGLVASRSASVDGKWSSNPSKSLSINSKTGVGVALSSGQVTVTYEVDGIVLHSQSIYIHGLTKVLTKPYPIGLFKTTQIMVSNNSTTFGTKFDVPVTFDDQGVSIIGTNCSEYLLETLDAPFSCDLAFDNPDVKIKISELFVVSPVFLRSHGRFVCRITQAENQKSLLRSSVINSKLNLLAKLNNDAVEPHLKTTIARYGVQSSPVTVKFNPAVYLHTPELILTTDTQSGSIIITGLKSILDDIMVIASQDEYLHISQPQIDRSPAYNKHVLEMPANVIEGSQTYSYHVRLNSRFWYSGLSSDERLTVKIYSSRTEQTLEIPVKIKIVSGPEMSADRDGLLGYLSYLTHLVYVTVMVPLLGLIILIVLAIGYRQYNQKKSGTTATNTAVFVTNPQFHGSPHRYAPTPPSSGSFSGTPGSGDMQHRGQGDGLQTPRLRLFSAQDTGYFGSPK
ncbi:hypothetical protein Ocin01_09896 [Orchesella cincta]|uniref:BIG2 domain-containing protein n=1 Tax=Orchesella cincta TaxID=48709 RepID=A0A1D2MUR3_ORCCI|nr:hypothetical protein Ocin01_09896 [Orchesella cincta]